LRSIVRGTIDNTDIGLGHAINIIRKKISTSVYLDFVAKLMCVFLSINKAFTS